jgi:phage terminase Nu1 subunit (DNA packaging protein)
LGFFAARPLRVFVFVVFRMTTIVNKRELARLVRRSEPTVDRWIEDGCPVIEGGSNGVAYKFDPQAVLDWRRGVEQRAAEDALAREAEIDQLALELTGGTVAPDSVAAIPLRDRAAAIDAERKALLLAREKRETMSRDDAARDYQAMLALLRQRLLSMPGLLARLAHLEPDQVRRVDEEMRALLRELSLQIGDPELRPRNGLSDAA